MAARAIRMAGTTIVVVRLFFSRFDGTLTTALSGKVFLVRAARFRNKGATHSRYEIKGQVSERSFRLFWV